VRFIVGSVRGLSGVITWTRKLKRSEGVSTKLAMIDKKNLRQERYVTRAKGNTKESNIWQITRKEIGSVGINIGVYVRLNVIAQ